MEETNKYSPQKKYLSTQRKQLRVWVDTDKYDKFQLLVKQKNSSIYREINKFIDDYINTNS